MKVNNTDYRTLWMKNGVVYLIHQNKLPYHFEILESETYSETVAHIRNMTVRGAGAIGAAGAFAMAQGCLEAPATDYLSFIEKAKQTISSARPTAQNLFYAIERVYQQGLISPEMAVIEAQRVADEDAAASQAIGDYGNSLIKDGFNVATHCNAGWLAFVDFGTALSPIYAANRSGKKVHVWVDETRPRLQGARLTAWELQNEGISHTIIPDNATAFLMSQHKIDLMIVGADRVARNGDTANKIGTLEKAIAAHIYNIPFYIAAPSSTFDFDCQTGEQIPIEHRSEEEVLWVEGLDQQGAIQRINIANPNSRALNPAFDVTPARFITGFITEKGIIKANELEITAKLINR
jgi:S-methyl-5-thioribose-1-phosphate isomerase